MKKIISIILTLLCVLTLASCAKDNGSSDGKLRVSVTFNAMKEFVEAVGKDKVKIETIIPDGTEPHDFEPKPKDMAELTKADVFVYSGMNMEKWVNNAVSAAGNEQLKVIEASKGIEPIKASDNSQEDPHVWLSIKCAQTQVKNIAEGLSQKDADNADFYKKNSEEYINKLESLYKDYSEKFKSTKSKNFVTGHAAFAYFCKDFGLEQSSVEDTFAEGEPSAKQMSKLIEYCKTNDVKTVFAEEMASPEVSKTLANTVGAKVETIYTFESNEDGKTYLERMQSNLEKIYASLK